MTNHVSSAYNQFLKVAILTTTIFSITPIFSLSLAQTTIETEWLIAQQTTKSLEIGSITHNGVNRALNPGETLTITMKGTKGVQASFLIIGDKYTVREVSAKEIEPGTYQSNIIVSPRERIVEGAVVGRLQRGKQVLYSAASQAFTYSREIANNPNSPESPQLPTENPSTSSPPQANTTDKNLCPPKFTSHRNGEIIDNNGFLIQGKTKPHAKVKITITSKLDLIGELLQFEGDKLIDQTIKANSEGMFQLAVPINSTAPSGLKYIINAVAILNNLKSEPSQLTLVQP
ncbi:MAG: hypothetical protein QNJ34_04130 [Xenococcaceae cyanobacterium MO_188.B29]|nr:hypothetical protein [Xenococcaceae cyanobacterium MO_188.B29]